MPTKRANQKLTPEEVITLMLLGLSPCAIVFYLWMFTLDDSRGYREVFFDEFDEYLQSKSNGKKFTNKWMRQAIKDLQKHGLITIVMRYTCTPGYRINVNCLSQPPC